jgi:hypothetical protein
MKITYKQKIKRYRGKQEDQEVDRKIILRSSEYRTGFVIPNF